MGWGRFLDVPGLGRFRHDWWIRDDFPLRLFHADGRRGRVFCHIDLSRWSFSWWLNTWRPVDRSGCGFCFRAGLMLCRCRCAGRWPMDWRFPIGALIAERAYVFRLGRQLLAFGGGDPLELDRRGL